MFQPFSAWAQNYAPELAGVDIQITELGLNYAVFELRVVSSREWTHSETERFKDLFLPVSKPYIHNLGCIVATVMGIDDLHVQADVGFYHE